MQWTQDLPFTHFPIHETVHLLSPIVIAIIEVKYSQEIQKEYHFIVAFNNMAILNIPKNIS